MLPSPTESTGGPNDHAYHGRRAVVSTYKGLTLIRTYTRVLVHQSGNVCALVMHSGLRPRDCTLRGYRYICKGICACGPWMLMTSSTDGVLHVNVNLRGVDIYAVLERRSAPSPKVRALANAYPIYQKCTNLVMHLILHCGCNRLTVFQIETTSRCLPSAGLD